MKKKLLIILACLTSVAGVLCGIFLSEPKIKNSIDEIENVIIEEIQNETNLEVVISNETREIVENTIEVTKKGDDISTKEIIDSNQEEEEKITDEGVLENDAVVEQENISYNGDNTGKGLSLLGEYQGLTYYSQADSRWANEMYSSNNNSSQTMKSSSCRTNFSSNDSK